MSFPAQTIFLLIYQSPATARYALEMSPSKCCSSKGLFPWTLCLLYLGALFAPTQEILLKYRLDLPYIQIGIEISPIPRDLIIVIFYYQISINPLKTLSLSQVSFPLNFPLCYIFPYGFMNSDKGKYKGKKIL